jgi:hypothetical protein
MKIEYTVVAGFANCYLTISDTLYTESENAQEELRAHLQNTYFSHFKTDMTIFNVVKWEEKETLITPYVLALTASELFDLLKLTRQQLHYYVKIGTIRKVYNPENPKQFRYDKADAEALYVKLKAKYIKHTM